MPRFLVSAAHKSSGKTVVSTGLAAALSARGHTVQTFKKGPDYIDPMWLGTASGRACYNLDFNTMGGDEICDLFAAKTAGSDLAMIEANKGLFDGVATDGGDSNAALARLLKTPVVLVVDTQGMTRGIAPLLLGYQAFGDGLVFAGVILNKTGGSRHERKLVAAIETYTDIPVLGAIRKTDELDIGERHLGLTTPAETRGLKGRIEAVGRIIANSVDVAKIASFGAAQPVFPTPAAPAVKGGKQRLLVGVARDAAFGFYYPDDLEAFAREGADLVPFDTLNDSALPDVDAVFIGGGFPETQMHALAANVSMRKSIKQAIKGGMPAYAECGGLMYLCRSLHWRGERAGMVGAITADAVMHARPQGRGYVRFSTTTDHLWSGEGQIQNAHEFHYASIDNLEAGHVFARKMARGAGISGTGDGIVMHNLIAGFCHLRNSRTNPWVARFVAFARRAKRS